MEISVSNLRANIYKIFDEIIESGNPVEVVRNGKRLRIVPEQPKSKLDRLKRRNIINCDPEQLIHVDWEAEWNSDDLS